MKNHATIDFETRGVVDLRKTGAWLYSKDVHTQAMCLAYKLPGESEVKLWIPEYKDRYTDEVALHGSELPYDLFEHIEAGKPVEAHNSFFERCIWHNIMVARKGWPDIPAGQWRCSAARASAASLPRSLEEAAKAMGLNVEKDMDGRKLMLKMCKPRPISAKKRAAGVAEVVWHEQPSNLIRLFEYCKQDVLVEEQLSNALPELSEEEFAIWQLDQEINWRGLKFDLPMAKNAIEMAEAWKNQLNVELHAMTGVESATRRAEVKRWLEKNEGLDLPDTAAGTLRRYLAQDNLTARARRVLEIVSSVNKTSTSKYAAMLEKCDPVDGRARDFMMYYGAATGRWAGKGIQIQNFPSRNVPEKNFELAAEIINAKDIPYAQLMYSDVMTFLSGALRGAIIPGKGKEFAVADYSSIEARVLVWLADDQEAIDVFASGGDIYLKMASVIYGREITAKDKAERQLGKMAILGLGYGMGYVTFLLTLRASGIYISREQVCNIMGRNALTHYEEEVRQDLLLGEFAQENDKNRKLAAKQQIKRLENAQEVVRDIVHELALTKYIVAKYRATYPNITKLWNSQNAAAIEAVLLWRELLESKYKQIKFNELSDAQKAAVNGPEVVEGKIVWKVENNFLMAVLPSGRAIRYRSPGLRIRKSPWGKESLELYYWSVNGVTRKYEATFTYGGKIVENLAQGFAREIIAHAMLRVNNFKVNGKTKYAICMSVHDELVSEVNINTGCAKEYEMLLCEVPEFAKGCPIAAEAEIIARYKK